MPFREYDPVERGGKLQVDRHAALLTGHVQTCQHDVWFGKSLFTQVILELAFQCGDVDWSRINPDCLGLVERLSDNLKGTLACVCDWLKVKLLDISVLGGEPLAV
jgi:hypothetical protein